MAGKKEKVTKVFEMTPDVAMKFFEVVKELTDQGVPDSKELRMEILSYLANNGYMNRVFETKRTKEQITEDFKKQGFKVDDRTRKSDD